LSSSSRRLRIAFEGEVFREIQVSDRERDVYEKLKWLSERGGRVLRHVKCVVSTPFSSLPKI
jgi:hypothetical protein